MKAYLLYCDKDFLWDRASELHDETVIDDSGLNLIFHAMAQGNTEQYEVVKNVVMCGLTDQKDIVYRQEIIKDCVIHSQRIEALCHIVQSILDKEKATQRFRFLSEYPSSIISDSVERMDVFHEGLKELRYFTRENAEVFESTGFLSLFERIEAELPDEYFELIRQHVADCRFKNGIWLGTSPGPDLKDSRYIMLKPSAKSEKWYRRILSNDKKSFSFRLSPSDESGAKALSELQMKGLNPIANALAQSADHIHDFLLVLKKELLFYIGCLKLKHQIEEFGATVCMPLISDPSIKQTVFSGLFDVALLLAKKTRLAENDCELTEKKLVIITGANGGGKTTFLRSLIQAQVMMQAGMFVGAADFRGTIASGVFTHFKKVEDSNMKSGKLDEEMSRMDRIISQISENASLFMNESFSSTNEKEGSEIAKQIILALAERNVRVYYVTHLYKCASDLIALDDPAFAFLRAERAENGMRAYRIREGAPQKTSYGADLYDQIFL